MKNSRGPKAPAGLSKEAKGWWQKFVDGWDFDEAALLLLESALESFDRMRQAQAIIKRDGPTQTDRFGQAKVHPAVLIERDSKALLLKQLKALNLDLEPILDRPGRPPGGGGKSCPPTGGNGHRGGAPLWRS